MSEKRTGTRIILMASQFAVLYFVKFEEATKCRRLNNLRFCGCFTTADMIIREHFSAEQVPFDGFLNWENTYEIISAYFPLLPKGSMSMRWPCCLYMSPSKLSDQLIDATNLYISIMQPQPKRRGSMVEMRTCIWE